jgi:hypothetical protein
MDEAWIGSIDIAKSQNSTVFDMSSAMKNYFVLTTGLLLLFFLLSTVSAAIIQVPEEYKTIQKAIDKADQGDTVLVKAGNYTEILSLKPGVTVKSHGTEIEHTNFTAAKRTILFSPGRQAAIIHGADKAVLDGFTLADKETVYNPKVSRVGVFIKRQSQTITNCIISNLPYPYNDT